MQEWKDKPASPESIDPLWVKSRVRDAREGVKQYTRQQLADWVGLAIGLHPFEGMEGRDPRMHGKPDEFYDVLDEMLDGPSWK